MFTPRRCAPCVVGVLNPGKAERVATATQVASHKPMSPIEGAPMKRTVLPRLGVAVAALALAACVSAATSGAKVNASSCTPAHKTSTVKKGVLTVALTNTPPYSFQRGNKLAGIDSAIVTTL